MGTGNRMFATITNCDLTHPIEVLGPKTDLEIKNCDINLPKASPVSRCKKSTLDESSGRGSNIKYLPYAFTEQGVYTQKGIE